MFGRESSEPKWYKAREGTRNSNRSILKGKLTLKWEYWGVRLRFAAENPTNHSLFSGQEAEWSPCASTAANRAHTIPVKQSLEKSVTRDMRSLLGKFNPSHVSHSSSASGLPATLTHH